MIDEKIINRSLKRKYGYQEGGQNFRIARTNDQTEIRLFTGVEGLIEPKAVNEFRELPRYNYLGERGYWVLERLFPVTGDTAKFLAGKWTYEPMFIYVNPETREPLPVTQDSIEALITVCLFGEKKRKTQAELDAEEEAYYEKQAGAILEYLQNEIPSMAVQLKAGSGIVSPGVENGSSDNRIVAPDGDSGNQAGNESDVHRDSSGTAG